MHAMKSKYGGSQNKFDVLAMKPASEVRLIHRWIYRDSWTAIYQLATISFHRPSLDYTIINSKTCIFDGNILGGHMRACVPELALGKLKPILNQYLIFDKINIMTYHKHVHVHACT